MSLIAAIVDWGNSSPSLEAMGQMLSALPARAPDGRRYCRTKHAVLGFGRRVIREGERPESQPLHDKRRGLAATGDVRLDNRQDLRTILRGSGAGPLDSDIAILLAAYERWGDETANRLLGDFAFVIWDEKRREVYAARDPFGVRPLVYRSRPGSLWLASDAAQLLALPETDRSPDPETVAGFLAWTMPRYGPTFFREIRSIPPGHHLRASAQGLRETSYFGPPSHELRYPRLDDYVEHFREVFRSAVRDRLDSQFPIVSHLSGGLDSSSIVCMAARIYAEEPAARPPLYPVSGVFPGQPYDETPFIDAVAGSVAFKSYKWNATVPSGREISHPSVGVPGTSTTFPGGSVGDLETAASTNARVLLSGSPGDLVTVEIGLFNELLRRGKWWTLLKQVAGGRSRSERRTRLIILRRALGEEAPPWLRSAWRSLKRAPEPVDPPSWLHPDLRAFWTPPRTRRAPMLNIGGSRLRRGTWSHLHWPWRPWALDFLGAYSADAGVEMRFPYLDRRLVELMLAVPYEHRLLGGLHRWIHRKALTGLLPDVIAQRESKPQFNGAIVRWGHASLERIRELMHDGTWHSGQLVDRIEARRLLGRLAARAPDPADREDWLKMRAIVNIEAWQRAVFRYPRAREILPMSDTSTKGEADTRDGVTSSEFLRYEAPRLSSVGNVRTLLASGTVSPDDGDPAPANGLA